MSGPLNKLSELISDWDPSWPSSGDALWDADPATLEPLARKLRQHIGQAVRTTSQVGFTSPGELKMRIESNHITAKWGQWETLLLDQHKNRMMTSDGHGGSRAMRWVTKRAPDMETLDARLPRPQGAHYLLIFWGHPGILRVRDHSGEGVAEDVATLFTDPSSPFLDVCFWHRRDDGGTLYSLRAREGKHNGNSVEFPDIEWLNVALGLNTPTAEMVEAAKLKQSNSTKEDS